MVATAALNVEDGYQPVGGGAAPVRRLTVGYGGCVVWWAARGPAAG
ncbi:hypothetical protein [Streptosporangium sp. NBC_01469]|nr:hypothetical protein [Streptosporangium sp. NBC_01469]